MKIALWAVVVTLLFLGTANAEKGGAWRLDERYTNTKIAQIDVERNGAERATAFFRCYHGRQLDAVVMFVGSTLTRGRTPVRYRLDDGEWRSAKWVTTPGGNGVFADDARAFALELAEGSTLSFEAQGADGTMQSVRYPLRGSREPISRVLAYCG